MTFLELDPHKIADTEITPIAIAFTTNRKCMGGPWQVLRLEISIMKFRDSDSEPLHTQWVICLFNAGTLHPRKAVEEIIRPFREELLEDPI